MMNKITQKKDGDITIFEIDGLLDDKNREFIYQLKTQVYLYIVDCEIDKTTPKTILDLTKVTFINASDLGALVSLFKRSKLANGELKLANSNEKVKSMLIITQLI